MSAPNIQLGLCANVFTRVMSFTKAGDVEIGHTHPFDHVTLLAYGSVSVEVEGKTTKFNAPHMIYIRADQRHKLTALEDNTVACCIHAIRDGKYGDILDPTMIPAGVKGRDVSHSVVNADPEWVHQT